MFCARIEKHSSKLDVSRSLVYIFGGSEIYRLPYISLLQNNSDSMDRNITVALILAIKIKLVP